jgi:hypothetical protein
MDGEGVRGGGKWLRLLEIKSRVGSAMVLGRGAGGSRKWHPRDTQPGWLSLTAGQEVRW